MSGWGYTVEFKKPSEVLKHLKLPPVTRSECEQHMPENYERYLTDDKFCAGYLNSSKTSGVAYVFIEFMSI